MAYKLIPQDVTTLREAFEQRKREYEALRGSGEWSGAVLYAGTLLELALKIAACGSLRVAHLPKVFQVHDLDFLSYCSGLHDHLTGNPNVYRNFGVVQTRWSMELRYEGSVMNEGDADEIHQALFDSQDGVLTFISSLSETVTP